MGRWPADNWIVMGFDAACDSGSVEDTDCLSLNGHNLTFLHARI